MAGTLPPTYYLIEHQGTIIGRGNSRSEAYQSLKYHTFSVTDDGRIKLGNKVLGGPSYVLKGMPNSVQYGGFTKEEALKDWFQCYAGNYLPYIVHRALKG